jgi:VanZ family protein
MGFMFFMSGTTGSAENTSPVIHNLIRKLFPWLAERMTPAWLDRLDFNLRKGAHVTEYAILSILAFRAVTRGRERFRNSDVLVPFGFGVAWAIGDEWHQSHVPTRWGAASDVFYDTVGVLSGLLLCVWRWLGKVQGASK